MNNNKWQNIKDNFFALKGLVILGSTDILFEIHIKTY